MGPRWTRTQVALGTLIALVAGALLLDLGPAPSERPLEPLTGEAQRPLEPPPSMHVEVEAASLAAVPAERVAAPEVPDVVAVPADGATVVGRVLDEADRGVSGVSVRMLRGSSGPSATTDADGRFVFTDLVRGEYRLLVDPRSLPTGFLPPWRQQVARAYTGRATGIEGTSMRVEDSTRRAVDLRVFRAATVTGRIVTAVGQPVSGALVQLCGEGERSHAARSDGLGWYQIAGVYPGAHTLTATLAAGDPAAQGDSPLPIAIEVTAGGAHVAPELVAGAGGCVLSGRVVDGEGAPIAGLRVMCRTQELAPVQITWVSLTDADGRFRLGRLPAMDLDLTVEDSAEAVQRGAERVAAGSIELVVSTIAAPAELDVGELRAAHRNPFQVAGRVTFDVPWARERGLDGGSLEVFVRELARPAGLVSLSSSHISLADRRAADPDPTAFDWACATPHGTVEFVARVRGSSGQEFERSVTVEPRAYGRRNLVLVFP